MTTMIHTQLKDDNYDFYGRIVGLLEILRCQGSTPGIAIYNQRMDCFLTVRQQKLYVETFGGEKGA